ncbi:DUF2087 domain-containing protein [Phytohabitans sp. ZYX-F-186]|uniref:DUF2087 domain-containing protein n=1 Tax=Phytohabitans maris TaxID=3071409 RepID=A0ABU0ZPK1_9ACTN|nr:DUF2087 domain-containing protein [Phytohabitans sp. ZYX-F-186]MDQ7908969.1 DUF2087 domain-containing protein [Phytohabitans sp. ZYX-F-186]
MRPDALCGLLAEPDRLATFAAVVLGAATPSEVAARTGLPARQVVVALRRLATGGLLTSVDGRIVAEANAFKEAVREHAPVPAAEADLDPDRAKAAVLRVFVRAGRIVRMPAARSKRRIILEHIAASFEPGIRYPERAVDAILRAWHDDHASLRRYLIDEGLMSREDGVYWRSGGYVEV